MSTPGESYTTRPFLKIRRAYVHNFEASRRKHFIHGLVEIDVTELRQAIRREEAAGKDNLLYSGCHPCCRPRGG
jgi:hypothetical protein